MTLESLQFSPGAYLAPSVDWLNANFHAVFDLVTRAIEALLSAIEYGLVALPSYAVIAIATIPGGHIRQPGHRHHDRRSARLLPGGRPVDGLDADGGAGNGRGGDFRRHRLSARHPRRPPQAAGGGVAAGARHHADGAALGLSHSGGDDLSLGRVPAIIATIVYGIPPMLRLTTLAFNQIPRDLVELGKAIGAPPRAILFKIEIPSAMPTLLVGLNQCILLSLAMVVLAGLVGAGGLGAEVTRGLTRMEMGLGLRAGLAIVAVAILLDRLSRGALHRPRATAKSS